MIGDPVLIERGGVADLDRVLALAAINEGAPSWSRAAWDRILEDAEGMEPFRVLLLAKDDANTVTGWLVASALTEVTELEGVLVGLAWRGRGVAQRLLAEWLTWARGQGAKRALLEVRRSNERALRLYRAAGFMEEGCRRDYYRDPVEDALVMVKGL